MHDYLIHWRTDVFVCFFSHFRIYDYYFLLYNYAEKTIYLEWCLPLAVRASTDVKPILASTMWTRSANRALPGTTTYESRIDLEFADVRAAGSDDAPSPSNTKWTEIDLTLLDSAQQQRKRYNNGQRVNESSQQSQIGRCVRKHEVSTVISDFVTGFKISNYNQLNMSRLCNVFCYFSAREQYDCISISENKCIN